MPAPPPAASARKVLSPAQQAMRKLGLVRDIDLALHLPLRYEDETRIVRIADTRNGDQAQVEGTVIHSDVLLQGRRQLKVLIDDGSDTLELRFFTFYPSHRQALAEGRQVRVRGEVRGGFIGRTMLHPGFGPVEAPLPEALTPVYPASAQLPQAYVRRAVRSALGRVDLSETLPARADPYPHGAGPYEPPWTLADALHFLHHPPADVALATLEDRSHPAWRRLKAEELLAQQLSQLEARRARDRLRAPLLPTATDASALPSRLLAALPFDLTAAQRRVVEEIAADMARPADGGQAHPMHRLLQGDVGAGKTVVAAMAACICIEAGHQCALMAPTEILASQHFEKLVGWLQPLLAERGRQVAWLTGAQKKKERTAALALVASGEAALVVGTHAVIQGPVVFSSLALAVIDEQHRFGVAQRLALREKAGGEIDGMPREPHLLMMTATPIPRTLAMSYYADLDVSTLDELPPGRTPVVTKLVADSRRDEVVARISAQLAQGRQVYWVCPLIEESEAVDLVNATQTHADLQAALPGTVIGLLHSRMPPAEKKAVMAEFSAGRMGVLVSTTVIEVGVDVPNASLMVIEHAERFGLSQLHQLRGRVGRGAAASACVLLYAPNEGGRVSEAARERLRAMAETSDGFEIARRDLEIRGPGEFLGARQSGAALLRFADLETDADLLAWARDLAPRMLRHDPALAARHVARWLGTRAEFLKA
ncbi:ATP-dependent DNA helicase RecG [Xylophilus sp. GOD-11R]|uniref:ATP-dependent DNA helicase RecG n=1 Tax=Xylophilus sp. GOD-11R TaxID=3089814 RepID=UPI00298D09ED|nr:ATP-dependent DNA helicase RecG [Xylophilus sp. GOD-11R]WPB59525.1 ATP-dependent DNA helicase RecG [Xylophilus sp. GOD-11R]